MEPLGVRKNREEAEDTLESWVEEDYYCPICQDVLKTPIRTKSCRHIFCRECFLMAVRTQGPHCPMCRGPVSENEKRATDILQQMRVRKGNCRACGSMAFLSKMRAHYKYCLKYIEEYGTPHRDAPPPPPPPPPPVAPTTQESISEHGGSIYMTGILSGLPVQPHMAVVREPTVAPMSQGRVHYSCPYCPLQGLTDMALVQHCVSSHRGESSPMVCPICASTPWGNPGYFSRNLIGHLSARHRFSYETYTNVWEDEDTQLYLTIQQSLLQGPVATMRR